MSSIKLFVCNKVTRQPQENAPPESLQRAHSYFCDNDCQGKRNVTSQLQLPKAPWNAASELADFYEPTGSRRRKTADFPSSACEKVVFPKFYSQWNIPDQRSASASTGTNTQGTNASAGCDSAAAACPPALKALENSTAGKPLDNPRKRWSKNNWDQRLRCFLHVN